MAAPSGTGVLRPGGLRSGRHRLVGSPVAGAARSTAGAGGSARARAQVGNPRLRRPERDLAVRRREPDLAGANQRPPRAAFAVPSGESSAITWPEADPPAEILSRLSLLAWRVPYLGRSTSIAQVTAVDALPPEMPGTVVYEPAELGQRGQLTTLRVPYPGYTDALRE